MTEREFAQKFCSDTEFEEIEKTTLTGIRDACKALSELREKQFMCSLQNFIDLICQAQRENCADSAARDFDILKAEQPSMSKFLTN